MKLLLRPQIDIHYWNRINLFRLYLKLAVHCASPAVHQPRELATGLSTSVEEKEHLQLSGSRIASYVFAESSLSVYVGRSLNNISITLGITDL